MNHYITNQNQLTPNMWENVSSGDTVFLNLGNVYTTYGIVLPGSPTQLQNITVDCAGTFIHYEAPKPKPKRKKDHPLTDFFKK